MARRYTIAILEFVDEMNCPQLVLEELLGWLSESEVEEFVEHFNRMYDTGHPEDKIVAKDD